MKKTRLSFDGLLIIKFISFCIVGIGHEEVFFSLPEKWRKKILTKDFRYGGGILSVITFGMIDDIDRTAGEWSVIADNIMFALVNRGEPFSADSWFERARSHQMPPCLIKKFAGGKFREFKAAGYIRKRSDFTLSERNGAAVLPLWEKA